MDSVVRLAPLALEVALGALPDFEGDGSTGNFAAFSTPYDVAIDRNGALYVADRFNRRIRKLVKDAGPAPKPSALLHVASGSAKLSPGSLFSLYGELLATTTKITGTTPWPRSKESKLSCMPDKAK